MRSALTPPKPWFRPGWVLPLALVALPHCSFEHGIGSPPPRIPPGTTLVQCDLDLEAQPDCPVNSDDPRIALGVPFAGAAVALAQGETGRVFGLDYSPAGLQRCSGLPVLIQFQNEFPAGTEVCVDPNAVGTGLRFPTSDDVCVERCLTMIGAAVPATLDDLNFCRAHARASTNVPSLPNVAFGDGCTSDGMPVVGFIDPRLAGEPVIWINPHNVVVQGNDLGRNTPCVLPGCSDTVFDAGAAGLKPVTHGDGYVEFTVRELQTNRIGGLTTGYGTDDNDPDFKTIDFGIDLLRDGCLYVFEKAALRAPPVPLPSVLTNGCSAPANTFGHYFKSERLRVSFKDNFDGTASIRYVRLAVPCAPGEPCQEETFYTSDVRGTYPLHVDASFQEYGGTLLDARVVYIH
jgi:hypothetical protein